MIMGDTRMLYVKVVSADGVVNAMGQKYQGGCFMSECTPVEMQLCLCREAVRGY